MAFTEKRRRDGGRSDFALDEDTDSFTASLVNLEAAMVWDVLFHVVTWTMTAAGLAMLFRAGRHPRAAWSSRLLLGAMLAGWGMFNLVEGVVDHHILHVHHVVERLGASMFDVMFLASGVVLMLAGGWLIRSADDRRWPGASDSEQVIASKGTGGG